jgi:hypothetical protein
MSEHKLTAEEARRKALWMHSLWLTLKEIDHLLSLLYDRRDSGEYYGNRAQYIARNNILIMKLAEWRHEAMTLVLIAEMQSEMEVAAFAPEFVADIRPEVHARRKRRRG